MKRLFPIVMLSICLVGGCQALQPATPVYKSANKARLTAVEPWLRTYQVDHPNDAVKVGDVVASWHSEVDAQQRTATTAP